MKVIIPVAGAGTTLRPHTHTQPKPLIPVAGKPILGHIVENLLAAGLDDFIFVVGHLGEKIRAYIESHYAGRFKFQFVQQEPRLGIAHSIWLCKPLIEGEEILISLGDTIIDADLRHILREPGSIVCGQEVEDPRKFGVAVLDDRGLIRSLIEKPSIPKSNIAMVGLYKIAETDALLTAIDHLMRNHITTHGEYQLTDALQHMVQNGIDIRTWPVNNWFDCGRKDMLLATNRTLLARMQPPTPNIPGSVIIPPVYIAEGCHIEGSIIGPYVAVAEHSRIKGSILQDTILGAYTTLDSIILKHSVIGNDTSLTGRWHSLNIGDNAEIDFNS